MKKYLLMGLVLLAGGATIAQEKAAAKSDNAKWKARFRFIAAVPRSTSYELSANPKTDVKATAAFAPELDFTYFFTKNLAAELILGTTKHKVQSVASGTKTDLGTVWLLPPTLNLQYHIPSKSFSPYFGAGINYTIFYGAKDAALELNYKNSVGFSTQIGCDFNVSDKWFINVDVKKLFLQTDVKVTNPALALNGVKLDPFIFGLGVGTKF